MSFKTSVHYQALTELVEIMGVASLIALIADAVWVVRDMYVSGVTTCMLLIAVFLWSALLLMAKALWMYHIKQVRKLLLFKYQQGKHNIRKYIK